MKAGINKAITATNGYKTKSAAFVFLLLQLLGDKIPMTPGNKEIVVNLVELLMASGLFHDFWRNREQIANWIKIYSPIKNSYHERNNKSSCNTARNR